MFRGLAENLVVGMYLLEDGRFRYVNQRLAQMLGYTREGLLGKSLLDVAAPDEHTLVQEKIEQTLYGESYKVHYERKARRMDGSVFDAEVFGSRFEINGKPMIAAVMVDVTSRKRAEIEAQFSSLVYHHSTQAMVVTDANGVILTTNPAFTEITGYRLEDVVGHRLNMLSSGKHDAAFYEKMWRSLLATGTWEGEVWNRRKDGEIYVEKLSISTTYNDDGSPRCRVGLFSDVTEHKKEQEHIWRQARHDHLTGLPNRYLFHECLAAKLDYADRASTSLALLYLDLDFFKDVNDTLGHAWGDELLRQVAQRLAHCVRKTDLVARLGGDEFCIIADGLSSENEIRKLCQKISATLGAPYALGDYRGVVSTCIGVAMYPQDAQSADDLLHNADLAMYSAKRRGRGEYAFYDAAMRREAVRRSELSRDLVHALRDDQFTLHYQPILDLKSQCIVKVEALLRWNHPEKGLIGPMAFIPQAEDSGLIVGIGEWVFRQATRMLVQWRHQYVPDLKITVNVSPVQLMDDRMSPKDWLAHLKALGLPYDSVVIEITERLLLDMSPTVTAKLDAFRDAGVCVALDDFGTGYSSVSYLKRLHIDYLKIDQSFVHQIESREENRALCDAIILMAHRLGLVVVAEGVATESQRRILTEMQCDFGQGLRFFEAMTALQFERLLKSN